MPPRNKKKKVTNPSINRLKISYEIVINRRMKIQDVHSLPGVAHAGVYKKAAQSVLNGMKQVEVARIFGVRCRAVGK